MIIQTQIEGTRLAGNLLGDPVERDLFVYLPPGYDESQRPVSDGVPLARLRRHGRNRW